MAPCALWCFSAAGGPCAPQQDDDMAHAALRMREGPPARTSSSRQRASGDAAQGGLQRPGQEHQQHQDDGPRRHEASSAGQPAPTTPRGIVGAPQHEERASRGGGAGGQPHNMGQSATNKASMQDELWMYNFQQGLEPQGLLQAHRSPVQDQSACSTSTFQSACSRNPSLLHSQQTPPCRPSADGIPTGLSLLQACACGPDVADRCSVQTMDRRCAAAGPGTSSCTLHTLTLPRLQASAAPLGTPVALLMFESDSRQSACLQDDLVSACSTPDASQQAELLATTASVRGVMQASADASGPNSSSSRPPLAPHQVTRSITSVRPDTSATINVQCVWLNQAYVGAAGAGSQAAGRDSVDQYITTYLIANRMVEGFCRNLVQGQPRPVHWWDTFASNASTAGNTANLGGLASAEVVQASLWPCQLLHAQDGGTQPVLHSAALLCLEPLRHSSWQHAEVLQHHLAAAYAPCMVTVVSQGGHILLQNPESCARLGCHTSSSAMGAGPGWLAGMQGAGGGWEGCLAAGATPPPAMNYLAELFTGQEDQLAAMQCALEARQVYEGRLRVLSPLLISWAGLGEAEELWYQAQITRMHHPLKHRQDVYCITQVEITEVVESERKVAHLQREQNALLQEILPTQVLTHLLSHKDSTLAPSSVASMPMGHTSASLAAAAGGISSTTASCLAPSHASSLSSMTPPSDMGPPLLGLAPTGSPLQRTGTPVAALCQPASGDSTAGMVCRHSPSPPPPELQCMAGGEAPGAGTPRLMQHAVPPATASAGARQLRHHGATMAPRGIPVAAPSPHRLACLSGFELRRPSVPNLTSSETGDHRSHDTRRPGEVSVVRYLSMDGRRLAAAAAAPEAPAASAQSTGPLSHVSSVAAQDVDPPASAPVNAMGTGAHSVTLSQPLSGMVELLSPGPGDGMGSRRASQGSLSALLQSIFPAPHHGAEREWRSQGTRGSSRRSSRIVRSRRASVNVSVGDVVATPSATALHAPGGMHALDGPSVGSQDAASCEPSDCHAVTGPTTAMSTVQSCMGTWGAGGGGDWGVPPVGSTLASMPGPAAAAQQATGTATRVWLTQQDVMSLATFHEEVTILFADIKGFTHMSKQLHPSQVMLFLNRLYSVWDSLLDTFGVYKVETIGDSYMVATGLFCRDPATGTQKLGGYDPEHCAKMLQFAQAMLLSSQSIETPLGEAVQVRIGIHTGSCSSGVVGQRMPRFCLFGDSVNTASRLESTGQPGCIHVSEVAHRLCGGQQLQWQSTGGVMLKGKGVMETWMLPVLPMGFDNLAQLKQSQAQQPPAPADAPAAAGNQSAGGASTGTAPVVVAPGAGQAGSGQGSLGGALPSQCPSFTLPAGVVAADPAAATGSATMTPQLTPRVLPPEQQAASSQLPAAAAAVAAATAHQQARAALFDKAHNLSSKSGWSGANVSGVNGIMSDAVLRVGSEGPGTPAQAHRTAFLGSELVSRTSNMSLHSGVGHVQGAGTWPQLSSEAVATLMQQASLSVCMEPAGCTAARGGMTSTAAALAPAASPTAPLPAGSALPGHPVQVGTPTQPMPPHTLISQFTAHLQPSQRSSLDRPPTQRSSLDQPASSTHAIIDLASLEAATGAMPCFEHGSSGANALLSDHSAAPHTDGGTMSVSHGGASACEVGARGCCTEVGQGGYAAAAHHHDVQPESLWAEAAVAAAAISLEPRPQNPHSSPAAPPPGSAANSGRPTSELSTSLDVHHKDLITSMTCHVLRQLQESRPPGAGGQPPGPAGSGAVDPRTAKLAASELLSMSPRKGGVAAVGAGMLVSGGLARRQRTGVRTSLDMPAAPKALRSSVDNAQYLDGPALGCRGRNGSIDCAGERSPHSPQSPGTRGMLGSVNNVATSAWWAPGIAAARARASCGNGEADAMAFPHGHGSAAGDAARMQQTWPKAIAPPTGCWSAGQLAGVVPGGGDRPQGIPAWKANAAESGANERSPSPRTVRWE